MPTEREKMLAGEMYDPLDPELVLGRRRARDLMKLFNDSRDAETDERTRLLRELLGAAGDGVWIEPPFFCDYGTNIYLGRKVYFNFGCVILDCAEVRVGDGTLVGPGVHIYAGTHPVSAAARRTGLEFAKPVTIGSDVWLGGGARICPGVTIGDRAVIGAGSVVIRDIPAGVIAVGNPARVVREIGDDPPGTSGGGG